MTKNRDPRLHGAPLPPGASLAPGAQTPPGDGPDASEYDEFWDTLDDEPAARRPLMSRLRRLPPTVVLLSAASFVSVAILALSMTVRDLQLPALVAAAVVTGIVFSADTAALARSTYRAGGDGRSGRALLLALVGGVAAIIAGLSFGWAAVIVLIGS
jgi:hypothetical protein